MTEMIEGSALSLANGNGSPANSHPDFTPAARLPKSRLGRRRRLASQGVQLRPDVELRRFSV
jgi:hypothetical protein